MQKIEMKGNAPVVLGAPKSLNLEEGRRYRGSLEVMRDRQGNQILVNHIYNRNTRVSKNPDAVTPHGYVQIFPFVHKVKFVFEFNVNEQEIADTMMDEASDLADFFLAKYENARKAG